MRISSGSVGWKDKFYSLLRVDADDAITRLYVRRDRVFEHSADAKTAAQDMIDGFELGFTQALSFSGYVCECMEETKHMNSSEFWRATKVVVNNG